MLEGWKQDIEPYCRVHQHWWSTMKVKVVLNIKVMKVKVLKLGESESGSPRKRPAPAIWRIPPWICLNTHLRHRPLLRRSLYLCFRKWESLMKICEFQFQLFQQITSDISFKSHLCWLLTCFSFRQEDLHRHQQRRDNLQADIEIILTISWRKSEWILKKKNKTEVKTDFCPDFPERRLYICFHRSILFAGWFSIIIVAIIAIYDIIS